jgi:hypothetical protein
MVTLSYDGSGMPSHLRGGMDFDGATKLEHGKTVEVDDVIAGRIVASWGEGTAYPCVRVVSGTPTPYSAISASSRDRIRRDADRIAEFGLDPARALVGLQPVPVDAKRATAADIAAGKQDAHLGALAVWAALDGKPDIAKAAARRGEALRLAVDGVPARVG